MSEKIKGMNKEAYHKVTGKMFKNSLINIPLFGVPAFTALFVGKYFDAKFGTNKIITLALLLIAFITSWILVLRNSKKLAREYKQIRAEMDVSNTEQVDKPE